MSAPAGIDMALLRFLDEAGNTTGSLPPFSADASQLVALYRAMVLARTFDSKAIALQRTGRIGTFPSALGQEAVGVGAASAMRAEDVLLPYYRDHPAMLVRGTRMAEILQYWGGDERGNDFAQPRMDFPICVPIATQLCHAAGVACAMKLKKEARVAVTFMGDGATSKGDFYEAMNFAGVWQLPVVMIINNNGWAISVPLQAQTAAPTLAQKALAAGMPGIRVDGNDVIAVRHAAGEAIERARMGGGPTLIEALSYRLGDHTTADDASRYRDAAELAARQAAEPLRRLRTYLGTTGDWDDDREQQWKRHCMDEVNRQVEAFQNLPAEPPSAMFDHLYAALPAALMDQRAAAIAAHPGDKHG